MQIKAIAFICTLCATIRIENMRLLLFMFIVSLQTILSGQNNDNSFFVEYDSVINELKTAGHVNDMNIKNYRYDFILLLDSSELSLIEQESSEDIEEFRLLAKVLNNNDTIVGFKSEKRNIRNIFLHNEKMILSCTQSYEYKGNKSIKLDFPIYVKENQAIFSISGRNWSETYFATLKENNLQIKGLYSIIE